MRYGIASKMNDLTKAYQQAAAAAQHSLLRHPTLSMAAILQVCAQRAACYESPDVYGQGAIIEQFEQRIAKLLGKPAALFLPSGTLAQPMALRIHAEALGRNRVLLHPTSHLVLHEQDGYQKLWGLSGEVVGAAEQVLQLADLQAVAQPQSCAALVLELPMREIGGQLPSWEALNQQVAWAREHGIAVHIDGARLWQCENHYGRSFAEICALADSVYVSLYKDLGGIAGAVLVGATEFVARARVWTRRAGGNLISMYPYILAAEQGLEDNLAVLPQVAVYARELAPLLNKLPGVQVNPEVPQATMFHLHIDAEREALIRAVTDYADVHGVVVLPLPRAVKNGRCVCEIPLGRNALQQPPTFWQQHLRACLERLDQ